MDESKGYVKRKNKSIMFLSYEYDKIIDMTAQKELVKSKDKKTKSYITKGQKE